MENPKPSDDDMNTNTQNSENILEVKDLVKYFPVRTGLLQRVSAYVKAVDKVSFTVKKAKRLAWSVNQVAEKQRLGERYYDWLNQLLAKFHLQEKIFLP